MQIINIIILVFLFQASASAFVVKKYIVNLQLNFETKSIDGTTEIDLAENELNQLRFPLYGIKVSSVKAKNKDLTFVQSDHELQIDFPKSTKRLTLQIKYSGSPTKGLVWGEHFVYTNYQPCAWMICFEEPGIRAPIEVKIKGASPFVTTSDKLPYSSYLYGFAAGDFTTVKAKIKKTKLEYFGIGQTTAQLEDKFRITAEVIKFFEEKSGVAFPKKKYTQVLIPGSEAQEKNGFAILGTEEIDPIIDSPKEDWAIVHELAHQWWGNLLTCKSWDHFWLNEGITVFMTAAYKQHKWGQEEYDRELNLARKRYQKAVDAQFDKPLSFNGEYPSMAIKRSITYSKGALFMEALRKELGEDLFWRGLQKYTSDNQYKSVVSKDFQNAMESATGKDLAVIFNKWVY